MLWYYHCYYSLRVCMHVYVRPNNLRNFTRRNINGIALNIQMTAVLNMQIIIGRRISYPFAIHCLHILLTLAVITYKTASASGFATEDFDVRIGNFNETFPTISQFMYNGLPKFILVAKFYLLSFQMWFYDDFLNQHSVLVVKILVKI